MFVVCEALGPRGVGPWCVLVLGASLVRPSSRQMAELQMLAELGHYDHLETRTVVVIYEQVGYTP